MRYVLIVAVELTGIGTQAQSSYPKYVSTAEIPITSSDGFNQPQGLVVAPDKALYVADTGNSRVLRIAPDGSQSTVNFGSLKPAVNNPTGVALDGNGNLYVTETAANRLIKLPVGAANGLTIITGLNQPTAVAADVKGNLAIVNTGNGTITARRYGGPAHLFDTGSTVLGAPAGVTFDAKGSIYVADAGNSEHPAAVYRFPPLGGTGTSLTPAGYNLQHLAGVTVDSQQNVYVLDSATQQLIEIPANGNAAFLIPQSNFKTPNSLASDELGNLYVSGAGDDTNSVTKLAYYNAANFGSLPVGSMSSLITFNFEFYEPTTVQMVQGISGGEVGERRTLLSIRCHHAIRGLEALLRVHRVRCRRRNLHDASIAVDLRRRDRGARVQVANHGDDFIVDQLLRDLSSSTRVSCVILRVKLKRDLLAADRQTLGIDFFNCEARAVFVVLAQVGNATGQRCNVTDLDNFVGRSGCCH